MNHSVLTTYDFIAQNKRRTWLLVLLFPLTFAALGYLMLFGVSRLTSEPSYISAEEKAYYQSVGQTPNATQIAVDRANQLASQFLPWLWLGAVLWIVISYYCGDQMILRGTNALEIYRDDQPEIYNLVENLCIASGLPMPRVYIINDSSLNAFATGRDPAHASIALTRGIVEKLERAELEGVVAHELSHIQNRDIRLMLITVTGISFFTFMAEICFRSALRSTRGSGKNKGQAALLFLVLGIFFALYGYIVAPLIRLAISRTREYQADATAAYMTRNPAALARALHKISGDARVEVLDKRSSMAAMCIANPLEHMGLFSWVSGLTATHPPIEKRIQALLAMDRGGSFGNGI
ncbi:MAG: M48 family metallopeptidase [Elusimicrobiaceae bacterium]|nr:M48 family metallopeptidase [Elusimicrobiaceae bacterium]